MNASLVSAIRDGVEDDQVISLINASSMTSINQQDTMGRSALAFAVTEHRGNLIQPLVAAKADVNLTNTNGITLLMMSVTQNPLAIQVLIEAQADINAINTYGETPLSKAVICNPIAIQPLLEAKADVNRNNIHGQTPLTNAISHNPIAIAILLEAKADIDRLTNDLTPLMKAVMKNPMAVNILLDAQADINMTNRYGETPLMKAVTYNPIAIQMLLEAKSDINQTNVYGQTALMKAVAQNPIAIQPLLDAKADLNVTNVHGQTPLMKATEYNPVAIRPLIEAQADVGQSDTILTTILMSNKLPASKNRRRAQLLIDIKADVHQTDLSGQTALSRLAGVHRKHEQLWWLLEHGANPFDVKDVSRLPNDNQEVIQNAQNYAIARSREVVECLQEGQRQLGDVVINIIACDYLCGARDHGC
jgi:ankyrin repeat protein